ncbi:hypothetical protein SNE40_002450 [Patella caerulea]|uniref:Immunoglobulin domain-containing protein n=1 Tax=Patella caerulea TaxID=87958 RepID=A0AAN8QE96_PATCE
MDDNDLGGLWTCQHGSDSSTYNVSYVDFDRRASITSFTSSPSSSNINVGTTITFTCTVSSTTLLPVNVSISSEKREGNLTYVINSSSRTFTVSTVAQCIDYRFYCRAYNGYGTVASTTLYKHVKCPVKLLHDKTNTTVNATVGSSGFFYAYYSGYPGSSYTWYRRLSDDEVEMSSYRTNWSLNYGCRYIRLQIVNVRLQDAGQYSVHINASGKVFIVRFKLNVNPVPISNSVTEEQLSDIQPFISAAGFGIGIAVGVIITLLVQGVVLLVSRILKSRDDKDKGVKPKRL